MNRLTLPTIALILASAGGCSTSTNNMELEGLQERSQLQKLNAAHVHQTLQKPLSAHLAVSIALVNNRSLKATMEDLGIARADVLQAALISNPKFFASIGFPNHGPASPDAEFSIAQDFVDILMVPLRKKIAADRLAATERRVTDAAVTLSHDVCVAFYTYQARGQAAALQKTIVEAQQASLELSRQQHKAGNISDLDLASEEATFSSMQLDLIRTEAQARSDREALNQLMGLWGADASAWKSGEKLPDIPEAEFNQTDLEDLAIRRRADLDAVRKETQAMAQALGLAEQFRLTGIEVGFAVDRRDPTEHYVTVAGPTLSVELPIFDQKQAQIARLAAEYRQGIDRLTAMAIDIRSQVRSARDRVTAAREAARVYRDTIIPQRQAVTKYSQLHYNVMLLGVDRWLMARQSETSAYKEYIEAVRDYWIARADLDRAIGGELTGNGKFDAY
jgi:cobalt-zinc-cadmium efflux system outer membrane protein